jgi:superfamily II DNA or RNA helicase
MREPYEYQKKIIDASVKRPFTMVQAACGTGKSLIAGQTAIRKGKPTLIITPKNIMEDFKAELMADGVPEKDIFVYSAAESHKEGYYEALEAWLKESIRKVENSEEEEDIVF